MTGIHRHTSTPMLIAPGELHELVRGQEQEFIARMTSIVRKQNVTLDFSQIERIDAAGIAALISLYGVAQSAGNQFSIVNACAHVIEILCLVNLDRVLIAPAVRTSTGTSTARCMAQPAA